MIKINGIEIKEPDEKYDNVSLDGTNMDFIPPMLLPCPFCGCNMFIGKFKHDSNDMGFMLCHEMQINPCIISQPSTIYATMADATTAWNKRTQKVGD